MRLFKVALDGFEPFLLLDEGDLQETQALWTQRADRWSLFFFEHDGTIFVNNRALSFKEGDVGFVVPGTKVGFGRVGEGTRHVQFTFSLTGKTEIVTVPAVTDLGDQMEMRWQEMREAVKWITVSNGRCLAFCFNLLWNISKPIDSFRKSDLIYDAEALIFKRLKETINVRELGEELGISHSHLLRLFREEHDCTIQEYIREKRVEVARQLILNTKQPLKEIAAATGMSDLHYFNKVIRAGTGLSPRALRERARK